MIFSVATVAFAAEGETVELPAVTEPAEGTTDSIIPDLGEYDWILDLPFWTVGPALKFAKIAFKLVSAYLKVAKIFGIVDKNMEDMILDAIVGLIESSTSGESSDDAVVTEPATDNVQIFALA